MSSCWAGIFPSENCDGLLGFAIHRTDPTEEEAGWLRGLKTFEETDPGFLPGSTYSTREHPVQSFMWADYSAKPGRPYDYRVVALKGSPTALQPVADTAVQVRTESPAGGLNDVHFNRGVAASQEYARRSATANQARSGSLRSNGCRADFSRR
jgi:hypothetical protein